MKQYHFLLYSQDYFQFLLLFKVNCFIFLPSQSLCKGTQSSSFLIPMHLAIMPLLNFIFTPGLLSTRLASQVFLHHLNFLVSFWCFLFFSLTLKAKIDYYPVNLCLSKCSKIFIFYRHLKLLHDSQRCSVMLYISGLQFWKIDGFCCLSSLCVYYSSELIFNSFVCTSIQIWFFSLSPL